MNAQAIETLYAMGYWLLESSRHEEAADVFRAMALAAPSDERAWLALASCHEAVGQHRIAIELYDVAARVATPAIRCIIARGRALRLVGRDDEAMDSFANAHELALEMNEGELVSLATSELGAPW